MRWMVLVPRSGVLLTATRDHVLPALSARIPRPELQRLRLCGRLRQRPLLHGHAHGRGPDVYDLDRDNDGLGCE